jgi:hypothetical protein
MIIACSIIVCLVCCKFCWILQTLPVSCRKPAGEVYAVCGKQRYALEIEKPADESAGFHFAIETR